MADYINRDNLLNMADAGYIFGTTGMRILKNYKASDVEPRIYAKWIDRHWHNSASCANCSNCGMEASHYEYDGVVKHYKRCPGCGAYMGSERCRDERDR